MVSPEDLIYVAKYALRYQWLGTYLTEEKYDHLEDAD